jgi:hypothetical protein
MYALGTCLHVLELTLEAFGLHCPAGLLQTCDPAYRLAAGSVGIIYIVRGVRALARRLRGVGTREGVSDSYRPPPACLIPSTPARCLAGRDALTRPFQSSVGQPPVSVDRTCSKASSRAVTSEYRRGGVHRL